MAVYHLIEAKNYEEAKEVVEDMIKDDETSQWARTWHARGVLYQTAYQEGIRQNDKKKYELYPNQLYVAFSSYETARRLDNGRRMNRQLAPRYAQLANEFQKKGERHFNNENYREAFRAFEQAIRINESQVLSLTPDNDLVYNTALAAYESNLKDKALEYLNQLDTSNYAPNVSHLLFTIHIENDDIEAAELALMEGIGKYEDNEVLVMLLVELLYEKDNIDAAIAMLDNAASQNPEESSFLYTKGLIYQKTEQYNKAIEAYKQAVKLAPDDLIIYLNLATCYYNLGVGIEEKAISLESNRRVMEQRTKSAAAFTSAGQWLDKAWAKNPDDPAQLLKMYQLYRALGSNDKARGVQRRFN